MIKLTKVMTAGLFIIIAMVLIKYKPVYAVTISGEEIGYVKSKNKIEKYLSDIEEINKTNIAFITIDNMPEYKFKLVKNTRETDELKVKNKIKESTTVMYTAYAITVNGQNKIYVDSFEEAEKLVKEIKNKDKKIKLGVLQVFSEDENKIKTENVSIAKKNLTKTVKEEKKKIEQTVHGVYLAVKPISGAITSRYGPRWGTIHTGLDIATYAGTPIKACADGKVTYAGLRGSYGNLVKIDHKEGVQTYYAHCSKIFVKVGDKVSAGDTIAAVGSTGNSTGPHLHLEIRVNGKTVNPQKYLYK